MKYLHFILDDRFTAEQRVAYVSALKHILRGELKPAASHLYKVWN